MAKGKNKGARGNVSDSAPEVEAGAESGPASFVLVTNTREGAIHVGPLAFPTGVSTHPTAVFAAFPPAVSDALADMVSEGWLKFEGTEAPEAPPPAVEPPPVVEPVVDPRPTLEAIEASTSAAELDAWFGLPDLPVVLSEAILARQSALSPA